MDSDCVFVRHLAPFLPFAEGDHLEQLILAYMDKAHIPRLKKRRGMHSLRHTRAARAPREGDSAADYLGHHRPS